jgi:3'-phosphoadenosine 5'-phosphosulfate sulfotransferase
MSTAVATVVVGVLSLIGTLAGSYGGIKLMTYRIEQLEKKVERHNSMIERTYKLEEWAAIQDEKIKVINHRIDDSEKEIEKMRG